MSKSALKTIYLILTGLVMVLSIAVSSGAAAEANANDTIDLKNGDKLTGTVLNDTFTLTTPYTAITLERNKISEIRIASGNGDNDVILLNAGGSLEGKIEELEFSFKPATGEMISIEKEKCKKIILKGKTE
jgi:hypothetical protein